MFVCITDALTFVAGQCIFSAEAETGRLCGADIMTDEKQIGWSGGAKVGNLGSDNSETDRTVTFSPVMIPEDGYYVIRVIYMTDNCQRFFEMTTEQGVFKLLCNESGGWDKTNCSDTVVRLKKGSLSMTFGSYSYCPDLDRVEIYRAERLRPVPAENREIVSSVAAGSAAVTETAGGRLTVSDNGAAFFSDIGFSAEVNGVYFTDADCSRTGGETETCNDPAFGVSRIMKSYFSFGEDLTVLREVILPESGEEIGFRLTVVSDEEGAESAFLAPVYAENADLRIPYVFSDSCFVCETPYDNDAWVKYETRGLGASGLAHECLTVIDGKSGAGLVIGSVTHDFWKTGIRWFGNGASVGSITVYGGAADPATRDKCRHGSMTGSKLVSPTVCMTFGNDWRECLDRYGARNTLYQPQKSSFTDRVPLGFNSWGVMADKVSYGKLVATSDFFREELSDIWQEDGDTVYINIDSFWTHLAHNDKNFSGSNDDALREFVRYCERNGQKAGIYHTPFAYWGGMSGLHHRAENTSYCWGDLALKLPDGGYYGTLDQGVALDPTHPGTREIIASLYEKFISMGYSYIKLDFLTHGACEGVWYDRSIRTGTQAYNDGMRFISDTVAGRMFINESIAPLFPYAYADGRRMSCDAWYSIHDTEDVMNHITYGFWEKKLYHHPDPDHLLIWGRGGKASEGEARARISSALCSGGSFLFGEDFAEPQRDPESAFRRFRKLMRNRGIMKIARSGVMFRPLSVHGEISARAFWGQISGEWYCILFSYRDSDGELSLDLPLPKGKKYIMKELWTCREETLTDAVIRRKVQSKDAEVWHIMEVTE